MPQVTRWTLGAATVAFAALAMLFASVATAAPSGGVSVTVTPEILSILVPPGAIGFGTTPVGTTVSVIDQKLVTNNGNVAWSLAGSFDITPGAADCTPGGSWTASTSPSLDNFVMNLDSDATSSGVGFDTPGVNIPGGGGLSGSIATGVAAAGTVNVDFELVMPTLASTGDNECTIAMTLTASS